MPSLRCPSSASTMLAPCANTSQLIDALPRAGRARLIAAGTRVELVFAQVLYEPGARIQQVYFPLDGFISDVAVIDGHSTLEVGLTGNEGMCGIALALGVNVSADCALVQGAGSALRIEAAAFQRELARSPALRRILNRYVAVRLTQLAQNAVCISSHVVEQRLARWLLMSHDRAHTDTFRVTHVFLAGMLGVRRAGVTQAAGALQRRKLIRYVRGSVSILNRRGLEAAACRCYRIDRETWQRLLG